VEAHEIYEFLHILSAIVWVGGAVLLVVLGASVAASRDMDRVRSFTLNALVAGRLFMIAAISTLVWGVLMVLDSDFVDFEQAWIVIGFIGVTVGAVLGPTFFLPQGKRLLGQLDGGDAGAAATARRIGMVTRAQTILLLVVVWAMVFKPGLG
jgi:uncharacterized membrane protein